MISRKADKPNKQRTRKNAPNPIDVHIGDRMHLARMALGMSQAELGERLDVTHQQIQKYEKGIDRVSGSMLFYLARSLRVTEQYFFDEYGKAASLPLQASTVELHLLRVIQRTDPFVKKMLVRLLVYLLSQKKSEG